MIDDDERREVAARLRDYESLRGSFRESPICAFLDALGDGGYLDWKGVCNRLADLIEPEPERTCHVKDLGGLPGMIPLLACDACGEPNYANADGSAWNYCPKCGAKVIGVDDD